MVVSAHVCVCVSMHTLNSSGLKKFICDRDFGVTIMFHILEHTHRQ